MTNSPSVRSVFTNESKYGRMYEAPKPYSAKIETDFIQSAQEPRVGMGRKQLSQITKQLIQSQSQLLSSHRRTTTAQRPSTSTLQTSVLNRSKSRTISPLQRSPLTRSPMQSLQSTMHRRSVPSQCSVNPKTPPKPASKQPSRLRPQFSNQSVIYKPSPVPAYKAKQTSRSPNTSTWGRSQSRSPIRPAFQYKPMPKIPVRSSKPSYQKPSY